MNQTTPTYKAIASTLQAVRNCQAAGNTEWEAKHLETLKALEDDLPSGSGFDAGTTFDVEASSPDRLVFHTSFHHMNEGGMYDGWTEHKVTVKPSLAHDFTVIVTGRNRDGIKDYIAEVFTAAMEGS